MKCIDKDKYTYFNRELGRKGYKKNEPIDVYIDHPSLFITAYRMHCNELEYSNEELANAFHLPQDVIERFCVPAKKVCGFFNLSESEHIYDTSLYVRANINDIKQHYLDAFYNPAIIRLYRLKEFVEGVAE